MSREDYEVMKRENKWKENQKRNFTDGSGGHNDLVIEQNTIYEIDYDCYECMMREKKKYLGGN